MKKPSFPTLSRATATGLVVFSLALQTHAATNSTIVTGVEWQPLTAQVKRVMEAMDYLGSPFDAETRKGLLAAMQEPNPESASQQIQQILDAHCLLLVEINPESRVKVSRGMAPAELAADGWREFLVKVHNQAGVTAPLRAKSPNAQKLAGSADSEISDRWLDLMMFDKQPLQPALSGLPVEYRIIELYSRDAGAREAKISLDVGQGTQDLGFRNETDILFNSLPALPLTLRVLDENNQPTTAAFTIRDQQGRVYPSQNKRLAPDFAFQSQVYRADGETILLPNGTYNIEFSKGPESILQKRTITVAGKPQIAEFKVQRWIDPSKLGWWSGDHHIHAAGCAHYTKPTEGVLARDMIRQCLGEDVKVGCNLTWGPCFDFQKQFFCGGLDPVSQYPYLLRYDVEVSGFGSHESGHLCLLRLKEEIYPGGDSDKHWPTLCLNTLQWAKKQGALVGPAHSGWGIEVPGEELPNYKVPRYDGIGANEYIADVTEEVPGPDGRPAPAVDFLSMVDTPYVWELNMWYQTLNVGFRTRISGETDFPCIYGERVGLGRSYVKLNGRLDYDAWCEGIRAGRNYVSDGRSHLMGFKVNDVAMGEQQSEVRLAQPGTVHITATVAARLDEQPHPEIQNRSYTEKPYWHIERARLAGTREVPVEVVVNGFPVARTNILADGAMRDLAFDVKVERSSWVALRILPSSHTNPIFVLVGDKPIAPSRRSAEWCLKGVDQCWSQKKRFIKADEMAEATKVYDHARTVYQVMVDHATVE